MLIATHGVLIAINGVRLCAHCCTWCETFSSLLHME